MGWSQGLIHLVETTDLTPLNRKSRHVLVSISLCILYNDVQVQVQTWTWLVLKSDFYRKLTWLGLDLNIRSNLMDLGSGLGLDLVSTSILRERTWTWLDAKPCELGLDLVLRIAGLAHHWLTNDTVLIYILLQSGMGVLCSCEPEWSRLPTLDWCPGVLPIPSILRMCHSEGLFLENFALHKGPLLTFCLTKGFLFGPKSASQKGPFQIKIEVSPLKHIFCQLQTLNFSQVYWTMHFKAFYLTFS